MNFDQDSAGQTIANDEQLFNQYGDWGFNYFPGIFSGSIWASNTDMKMTSADVGSGYSPSHGNVLHSLSGWQFEDGDPSILLQSDRDFDFVSMTFVGDSTGTSGFGVYDENFQFLGGSFARVSGSGVDDSVTLMHFGTGRYVVILPGDQTDWAAVDNVTLNVVPEPSTIAIVSCFGLASISLLIRIRKEV